MDELGKIPLCALPTPLLAAPRLGEAMGIPNLWLKRDDLLGLALGGNKLRKMEYIAAAAMTQGAGAMVTSGSWESNLVSVLSVTARILGMKSGVVFMVPSGPRERNFNSLLEQTLGTEVRGVEYVEGDLASRVSARHRAEIELADLREELDQQGLTSYTVPEGGACLEGSYSFVEAFDELHGQMLAQGHDRYDVYLPVGSGSTYAGLWCGARRSGADVRIRGIGIALPLRRCLLETRKAAARVCEILQIDVPEKSDLDITDEFLGKAYAAPSEESREGVRLALETSGLLMDHTYSGKALGGMKKLLGREAPDRPVVFWHTGGVAGAVDNLFRD
jgi:1-aminocyclopropane-1-carboxylate deaminase/D-cysteine desulfhydrase-like pyridoxal-dependent ACC family enzyme